MTSSALTTPVDALLANPYEGRPLGRGDSGYPGAGFTPTGPLDRAQCALATLGKRAMDAATERVQPRLFPERCCDRPDLCPLETQWRQQFIGCPSTHIQMRCKMYRKDPRLWEPSLNNKLYERAITSGAIWNPYKHFFARQNWAQFITTEWRSRKDNHMRAISSLDDAYCVQASKRSYGDDNRPLDPAMNRPVDCITPREKMSQIVGAIGVSQPGPGTSHGGGN